LIRNIGKHPRRYLTRGEFSEFTNVSLNHVGNAVRRGHIKTCERDGNERIDIKTELEPFLRHCRSATIADPGELEGQGLEMEMTISEAKQRTEIAKAQAAELDYAMKSGQAMRMDEVQRWAANLGANIQKAVLGIADRIAPVVAAEDDARECWILINTETRMILEDLSDELERYASRTESHGTI